MSIFFFSSVTANHIQSLICLIGGMGCLLPMATTPLKDYGTTQLHASLTSQRFKDSALFTMSFTLPLLFDIISEVFQSLIMKQKTEKAKMNVKDALLNTRERFILYCGIITIPILAFMPVHTQNLANLYLCLKRSRSMLIFGSVVTSLCRYNEKLWTVRKSNCLLLLLVTATFSGSLADNTSVISVIPIAHKTSMFLYLVTGCLFFYCNGNWICSFAPNVLKWLFFKSTKDDEEPLEDRGPNSIFPLVYATATSIISTACMVAARSYTGDRRYCEEDLFIQNLLIVIYLLVLMYISETMLKYEVVQGLVRTIVNILSP
jgi:hypothetical protein